MSHELLGPLRCASFEAGHQFPYFEFFQGRRGRVPARFMSCLVTGVSSSGQTSLGPLSAAVALLISGAEGRSGDPDSLGLVGKSVALALDGSGPTSGLCYM